MAIDRSPHTLHITLENVSPADALALMKMFKHIELPEVPDVDGVNNDNSFKIDSDAIAWKIYHD